MLSEIRLSSEAYTLPITVQPDMVKAPPGDGLPVPESTPAA